MLNEAIKKLDDKYLAKDPEQPKLDHKDISKYHQLVCKLYYCGYPEDMLKHFLSWKLFHPKKENRSKKGYLLRKYSLLKSSKTFVQAAIIGNSGFEIFHASEELKKDVDLVKLAIYQMEEFKEDIHTAFAYLPEEIRLNKEIILLATKYSSDILRYDSIIISHFIFLQYQAYRLEDFTQIFEGDPDYFKKVLYNFFHNNSKDMAHTFFNLYHLLNLRDKDIIMKRIKSFTADKKPPLFLQHIVIKNAEDDLVKIYSYAVNSINDRIDLYFDKEATAETVNLICSHITKNLKLNSNLTKPKGDADISFLIKILAKIENSLAISNIVDFIYSNYSTKNEDTYTSKYLLLMSKSIAEVEIDTHKLATLNNIKFKYK